MNKERIVPISSKSCDILDALSICFYDCEFLEDFGEFKKGDFFTTGLCINYGDGIVEKFDETGKLEISQKFTCIPIIE